MPLQQFWLPFAQLNSNPVMTPRRFYFTIKEANVVECVQAHSLTEAKLIAADTWLPWWNQIEWLNPESVTDPNVYI